MRTFGTIKRIANRWHITAEPHVSMRLKDVFKTIAKSEIRGAVITDSPTMSKDLDWFMQRYPLAMDEATAKALADGVAAYDQRQTKMEQILLPDYTPGVYALVKPMRGYQAVAVDLLMQSGALLCGDDVGLGKTIVGIGAMVGASNVLPVAVVCQSHLTAQWASKIEEFAPNLRVHVVKTRKMYNLPEADVYIFTYARMIGWGELVCQGFFKMAVFDEVQELRSETTEKYRVAELLRDQANYMLGLSATPVYNYGGEIFSIMNILQEGCLGSREEFARQWCSYNFSEQKQKVKDPEALGAFLRENHLMIRRRREDVSRELPPINKIVHEVEYNEKTADSYEKDLKQIAARVLEGKWEERGIAARQLDIQARMMTGVAKAQGVADYVKLLLESGEKVLLTGWHREVYTTWMRELKEYNPVLYTGTESPTQKEQSREDFISGKAQLMIMSLRSGVGLDGLQESCSIVVFGELDWSPQVHEQVIGRLRRDGQLKQVMAVYLTSSNGTDPLMIDILGLKAAQSQGIMNPGQNDIIGIVADDNRLKKLAQAILER